MSNISSNIGVGSGIPEVAEIPATGSDGDLIKFRNILFRWDVDAGSSGAWIPLPTREWQTFEDWPTGDLSHWEVTSNDAPFTYSISKDQYLEVVADPSEGTNTRFRIKFASGDVQLRKGIELRMTLQKRSAQPSSGKSLARYIFRKSGTDADEALQYCELTNTENGDLMILRMDDNSGDRDTNSKPTWDWSQNDDTYFHVGLSHRDQTSEIRCWGEAYDSTGTLAVETEDTATPVPDSVNYTMELTIETDADIQQVYRIYSMSMRSIG